MLNINGGLQGAIDAHMFPNVVGVSKGMHEQHLCNFGLIPEAKTQEGQQRSGLHLAEASVVAGKALPSLRAASDGSVTFSQSFGNRASAPRFTPATLVLPPLPPPLPACAPSVKSLFSTNR